MKLLFIPILFYDGIDNSTGAVVAGTSQLAATAINAMAQSKLNKDTMNYNIGMYNKQRADNLTDLANAQSYNSPQSQMQRYQQAGLNPNLIYGNSNSQSSPVVKSATVGSWSPKAPDYSGIAQGMGNALSVALQQKQLDNMDAQQVLLQAQAAAANAQAQKTTAEIPGVGISQQSSQFDLDMKKSVSDITKAQSYADLQRTLAGINNTLTDTQTKQIMQAPNLATAVANLLRINAGTDQSIAEKNATNARIQGIMSDNQVKAAEARLAQFNIFRSDPEWIRAAILLAQPQNANPSGSIKAQIQLNKKKINPQTGNPVPDDKNDDGSTNDSTDHTWLPPMMH